jgi:predicted transcriptional regulator
MSPHRDPGLDTLPAREKGIDSMKTLTIGIAGYVRMKARTLAMACGGAHAVQGESKVWFTLIDSLAKLLSAHNRGLLELIAREHPRSLTELAEMAGRSSRTFRGR